MSMASHASSRLHLTTATAVALALSVAACTQPNGASGVGDFGVTQRPGGTTGGRGMGLGNTRERLKVLYGESAGLTLERAGTETAATLTLPFTTHAPADER